MAIEISTWGAFALHILFDKGDLANLPAKAVLMAYEHPFVAIHDRGFRLQRQPSQARQDCLDLP
ncbi:MAG: hypothetical protein IPO97_06285 [Sphingomonadales bacterium]|nr:hypothetical protein [Sphingomonadales bacterium]